MDDHNTHQAPSDLCDEIRIPAGHDSDGITFAGKRTPAWLIWLGILTLIMAIVYLIVFGLRPSAPGQEEAYRESMADFAANLPPRTTLPVDSAELMPFTSWGHLKSGRILWDRFCSSCHLAGCQGFLGPNLTDSFSIHGCSYPDIVRIISHGKHDMGMISWERLLTTEQILDVASFVLLKKGSKPPDPRIPQGDPCPAP